VRETLYMRLSQTERVSWLLEGEPDQVREGVLAEAATAAAGRQVVVLVPGADIMLAAVAVPTRNRSRMAAAVPFLLEEQLASDVDDAHFALGERDAEGRVAVAVVSRARMNGWLARLAESGIHADKLIPETLLLPHQAGEWSLLREPECVTVRTGAQNGMALDAVNTSFVLQRTMAELAIKPNLLRVWFAGGAGSAMLPAELGVEAIAEPLAVPALSFLVRQAHEQGVIDLLQGPYSRRERIGKFWRPWRPVAALVAVWAVLQFGINIYQYRELRAEDGRLHEEVNQIYLQTFPEAKRVVDARVQMEQRLTALRGGKGSLGDFMKLLAAVSGPAASLGGVDIERLSYRDGEFDIALTVSDLQRLDQLKDRLGSETQLAVEIQSASARNDKVEARLQIKGGRS